MQKLTSITIMIIIILPIFISSEFVIGENNNSSAEEYRDGFRYNTNGWIYVHIEGDPYERGFQHGYLLADEIVDMIQRWQSIFPSRLSWNIQRNTAMRLFWKYYPDEYKKEIEGIADGVAEKGGKINGNIITYQDILALNEMYELLSRHRTYYIYRFIGQTDYLISNLIKKIDIGHIGKCSAFLATGDATVDGRIVAAHSTFSFANENIWWHMYISERFNVILDIKPSNGNRIIMSTAPGLIWSDEDFYQNDAGMILMETTLDPPGNWKRTGTPVVVRARKAIQYSNNIDDVVDFLVENNNGLMANDWLIGDIKTGEIASLELALRNHELTSTKNGFIWSCNNAKDEKVRRQLNSVFGFGILSFHPLIYGLRAKNNEYTPTDRDSKFEELSDEYYGSIDVEIAKLIMSSDPINCDSMDCKITDSNLVKNNGLWAIMGRTDGIDFISDDHPFRREKQGYTDLPSCGWANIYGISDENLFRENTQKSIMEKNRGDLIWVYENDDNILGDAIYSDPIIEDGVLYFTSWAGDVVALDVNSGESKWNKNIGFSCVSSPTYYNDNIYVGSNNGLYVLDKDNGRIIWKRDISSISSKPVVINDVVYCGSYDGFVYAIDSSNGDEIWSFKTNSEVYSSPVVDKNILFVGSSDNVFYAIDKNDGNMLWSYDSDGPISSSPIVNDGFVYFGSWDSNLYAVDIKSGELIWKFTAGWGIDSSPTIKEDTVYFGSKDNNLYALDKKNGELKWIFTTDAGISSSPIVYGGYVFFGSEDGNIYALNVSCGDIIWKMSPDYSIEGIHNYKTKPIVSSPVAYDGKIFIGSTNGNIYCYDAQTYENIETVSEGIEISIDNYLF